MIDLTFAESGEHLRAIRMMPESQRDRDQLKRYREIMCSLCPTAVFVDLPNGMLIQSFGIIPGFDATFKPSDIQVMSSNTSGGKISRTYASVNEVGRDQLDALFAKWFSTGNCGSNGSEIVFFSKNSDTGEVPYYS